MRLRILPTLLILSLLTIGVFGFLGLGSIDHSGQHSCPVSLVSGGDCPPAEGTAALAFHHASGLQNFIQSVVNLDVSLLALSVLLVFASLLVVSKPLQEIPALQPFSCQTRHRITESALKPKKRFLRWLALHYKRDPHALQWAYDIIT